MGRNGVGKTTTLKVMIGLLPARSGRMMFDGADITKEATDRRAKAGWPTCRRAERLCLI